MRKKGETRKRDGGKERVRERWTALGREVLRKLLREKGKERGTTAIHVMLWKEVNGKNKMEKVQNSGQRSSWKSKILVKLINLGIKGSIGGIKKLGGKGPRINIL